VSLYQLPDGLPVPEDDGATDHLLGQMLPQLTLESSQGSVSVRALSMNRLVLYVYPRTGRPDTPAGPDWDAIPGARGCTPQSCAFRDHTAELEELGAAVAGLSAQSLEEQVEFAERNHIPYPVIADPERKLGAALRLPTFEYQGMTLYKRVTLVIEACAVAKVFYPVFPPDRNAAEVVSWLRGR
jgi:peroxiredoxin